jgi:hypothetical protein
MLSLDDARWGQLQDAYGTGSEIPDLLRALAASTAPKRSYTEEPWYSLWSRLCHQGDVYTGSYAAVPHIVKIVTETPTPVDFSFFLLPASIEVARHTRRGPQIPDDLAQGYDRAIALLADAVSLHRAEPWNREMLLSAIAAQAVAKGHMEIAEALMNLDAEWIAKIINGE